MSGTFFLSKHRVMLQSKYWYFTVDNLYR